MLRASHAVGRFVGLYFLRGYLCFASCVGICALLLSWVFVLCFLRGYLRFASCVGICASRGF